MADNIQVEELARIARYARAKATESGTEEDNQKANIAEVAASRAAKRMRRAIRRAIRVEKWTKPKKRGKKRRKKQPYPCMDAVMLAGRSMTLPYFSFIVADYKQGPHSVACDSLARDAHIPFEAILAGPNPPTKPMSDNSKYIQTNVNPAQCLEIAARSAIGEYLIVGSSDLQASKYFLNKLYIYTRRLQYFDVFLICRLVRGESYLEEHVASRDQKQEAFLDEELVFDKNIGNSPVVAPVFVIRRSIWYDLNGIDVRFNSSLAGIDIQMRCHEQGITPFVTPDCWVYQELQKYEEDQKLLNSLWITESGKMSKNRLSTLEPFVGE